MSKRTIKPEIKADILKCLEDGEKTTAEIKKAVSGGDRTIDTCLSELKESGEIVSGKKGVYALPESAVEVPDAPAEVENSREESENIETINKMLKIYDIVLDDIALSIVAELAAKATIEEKINLIKSLRWLGATVDQLMKRWYLVHRGYDSNTKQAHEDAKQKTVDREKRKIESAPPQSQLKVVREYGEGMRDILAKMPQAEQKKTKV